MAFKDTAVGKFLADKAPAVLDAVGDVFPPARILTALLDGSPDIKLGDRIEFEKLVREYEAKERADYLADVANARDLQKAALAQDDKFSKRFIYWFTAGSVILGFAYIFFITFCTIPTQGQRFADTILGVVISIIFGTIYNFFYGSSKGSHDKNDIIQTLKKQ
jgi:hypothetical protein